MSELKTLLKVLSIWLAFVTMQVIFILFSTVYIPAIDASIGPMLFYSHMIGIMCLFPFYIYLCRRAFMRICDRRPGVVHMTVILLIFYIPVSPIYMLLDFFGLDFVEIFNERKKNGNFGAIDFFLFEYIVAPLMVVLGFVGVLLPVWLYGVLINRFAGLHAR